MAIGVAPGQRTDSSASAYFPRLEEESQVVQADRQVRVVDAAQRRCFLDQGGSVERFGLRRGHPLVLEQGGQV